MRTRHDNLTACSRVQPKKGLPGQKDGADFSFLGVGGGDIDRERVLVLVLVDFRREKNRQGVVVGHREGDYLGFAAPFFMFLFLCVSFFL
jgi:hypothetical protein